MKILKTKATFESDMGTFYLDEMENEKFNITRDEITLRRSLNYFTALALFVKMAAENESTVEFEN